MNGLIKNGVVRRCWIARHGTDPAGQEMNVMNGDQQSSGDRELGYVCLNTSHIPLEESLITKLSAKERRSRIYASKRDGSHVISTRNFGVPLRNCPEQVMSLPAHSLLPTTLSLSLPLDYEQLVRVSKLYILLASS
jgi:hypothetical protein